MGNGLVGGHRRPANAAAVAEHRTRINFLTSLAIGLAAAGWTTEDAAAELANACDDDRGLLDAASARVVGQWVVDRATTLRAMDLLAAASRRPVGRRASLRTEVVA